MYRLLLMYRHLNIIIYLVQIHIVAHFYIMN